MFHQEYVTPQTYVADGVYHRERLEKGQGGSIHLHFRYGWTLDMGRNKTMGWEVACCECQFPLIYRIADLGLKNARERRSYTPVSSQADS